MFKLLHEAGAQQCFILDIVLPFSSKYQTGEGDGVGFGHLLLWSIVCAVILPELSLICVSL